ncbi:hypothetical protein CEW46_23915 [Bacillus cereus]|nr:hypothetical protein CEW46_23915 [Bacillus cereus]
MKYGFEVEDIRSRENFSVILNTEDKTVCMFDTSRGRHSHLFTYQESIVGYATGSEVTSLTPTYCKNHSPSSLLINPEGCCTAQEYYDHLKKKALKDPYVPFCWELNPDTFRPLDEE